MKITTTDKTIKELLGSHYYRIPRFQRPYSWTSSEVEEFWDDTIVEHVSDYFIGAIVVHPSADEKLEIVDGQQRITTITLLLAALRDSFKNQKQTGLAFGLQNFIEKTNLSNEK